MGAMGGGGGEGHRVCIAAGNVPALSIVHLRPVHEMPRTVRTRDGSKSQIIPTLSEVR